jgi:hypothetical protein
MRKILFLVGVFLLLPLAEALAQESAAAPGTPVLAATRSEIECAGFISSSRVPEDLYVFSGADNDFQQPLRQYSLGAIVFIRGGQVGTEYRLVRPATALFRDTRYDGQRSSLRSLGAVYEDVGRVKVTGTTPYGALGEVTYACAPIQAGDFAIPYQERAIPTYIPNAHFSRFGLPKGQKRGAIPAARNNADVVLSGSIVYIDLGQSDGVHPGQRFRIYRNPGVAKGWFRGGVEVPRESLGELVVLSTEQRSSSAIVVTSLREITLGDMIDLE